MIKKKISLITVTVIVVFNCIHYQNEYLSRNDERLRSHLCQKVKRSKYSNSLQDDNYVAVNFYCGNIYDGNIYVVGVMMANWSNNFYIDDEKFINS